MLRNISAVDNLTIYPDYLYRRIIDLLIIKSMVKNWKSVLLFRLGIKSKVVLNFRDGYRIKINSMQEYNRFWDSKRGQYYIAKHHGYNNKIQLKRKIVEFDFNKNIVKFFYSDKNALRNIFGTIKENFIDEQFKDLNVSGYTVVDVGANVCDSAIYFALKGARHVYAFEPYPYSYNLAKKNIRLNNLKDRVTLLNEGCGKDGFITIDPSFKNTAGSRLIQFKDGKSVKVTSLNSIVNRYKIKNSILKIDCEGCEYELVLNATVDALRRFDRIMIEYHYGYKNLEKKLLEAKFNVKHTKPKLFKDASREVRLLGMIYASKNI
ncbi:MAG: FkbM family methyltransferase [Caldisphaera sp.]